jgi:uncharacterized protein YqgV (UPF0045/DUF77 family)
MTGAPTERVPLNLIEVILAQGSTLGARRLCFLAPASRLPTLADLPLHEESHMAHPFESRFHRLRLSLLSRSLLSLSLLTCSATWAQQTSPAPTRSTAAAAPAASGHVIAEIQVIPRPAGTADDRYKHVDAAIAVIQASGLRYEVHALGTVVEGPPEKVWPLLQAVHQATLEAGAERTLSVIKVSSGAQAGGPRVEELVRKFRR